MKNRYEVVRQDNYLRLWYIWDNKENCAVSDVVGNTIYYGSDTEAWEESNELNAIEED